MVRAAVTAAVALLTLAGGQARAAEPIMQVWSGKGEVTTDGGKTLARFQHLSLLRLPNGRLMANNMDGTTMYAFGGQPSTKHSAREYEYPADHIQIAVNGKSEAGVKEYIASGRCRIVYTPSHILFHVDCQTDTEGGVFDLHFFGDKAPPWSPGPPQRIPPPPPPAPVGHHISGADG